MNNLAAAVPTIVEQSSTLIWCNAILCGPYLKGKWCKLQMDQNGRILRCNYIKSVYSGKPQFDRWFRDLYNPVVSRS